MIFFIEKNFIKGCYLLIIKHFQINCYYVPQIKYSKIISQDHILLLKLDFKSTLLSF